VLDDEVLAKIDGFWAPPPESPILLVEVYEAVVRDARTLIRSAVADGLALKAHDAIHLATAKRAGAAECWTYDVRLLKFDGKFGFRIRTPHTDAFSFPE